MAKTSPEIYQEAKTVRNETGARKNTALRVGTVLTDLAEFIGETVTVDNLRFVASQSTVEMEISRVTADGTKKTTLLKFPAATTEKAGILLPGDKQLLGHMHNLGQFANYDSLLAAAAQPTCVTVQEFVLLYGVVNNTSGPRSCVIIQQVGFNADGSGSTMQYIYWERRQYTRYVNFSSTAVTDVQSPQNSGARNLTLSGTLLQMKNAWGDNVGSGVYVPNATTSKSGFLSPEDKTKLDGLSPIQMTNYDHQSDKIVFKIVLKNGTQWFLYANAATSTTAGVMTAADKKKLDSLKGVKAANVARSPEAVLLSITCSETPNLSMEIPAATTELAGVMLPEDKQALTHVLHLGDFTSDTQLLAEAAEAGVCTEPGFALLHGTVNSTASYNILQSVQVNSDLSGKCEQIILSPYNKQTRTIEFSSTAIVSVSDMKDLRPMSVSFGGSGNDLTFYLVGENIRYYSTPVKAPISNGLHAGFMSVEDKNKLDGLKGIKTVEFEKGSDYFHIGILDSADTLYERDIEIADLTFAGLMSPEDRFTINHIKELGEFSAKDSLLQASAVFNLVSDPHICLMYGAVVTEGAKNAAVIVQQVTRNADGSGMTMQYFHYGKQRYTRYINFSATAVTAVQGLQADGSRNLTLSGNLLQMKDPWGTNVGSGVYLPAASDSASGLMTAADKKEITALRTLVDELAQRVTALENA